METITTVEPGKMGRAIILFQANYGPNFIKEVWGDGFIASHLKRKFEGYANESFKQNGYVTQGAVAKFMTELSGLNMNKLCNYIASNPNWYY